MGRCLAAAFLLLCAGGSPFETRLMGQTPQAYPVEYELGAKTLTRSVEPVWSLAVSQDGNWLAYGNETGQVILQNTITAKTARLMAGHAGIVSALAFSPSGEWLASAGLDGTIRLWDAASGRPKLTMSGHESWINGLEFSPDGKILASAGYDKTVRLWNPGTGVETAKFTGHAETVRSLTFSPDGKILVSAGDQGVLDFWNIQTVRHTQPFPRQTTGIQAVDFSPDGKSLITAPAAGKIQVWDLKTRKPLYSFKPAATPNGDATPQTACFAPNGLSVLASTRSGMVQVSSLVKRKTQQTFAGHSDVVTALAVSPDGRSLYTAGLDGKVLEWPARLPLEKPLAKLPVRVRKVWAVAVSLDSDTLAVGGKGDEVELWDIRTGERKRVLAGFDATVDRLEFLLDGKTLAAAGWRSEKFLTWNTETGEVVVDLKLEKNLRAFAVSPDGKTLAVGHGKESAIGLYSLPDGKKTGEFTDHELSIYDLAFSADGRLLASCSGEWTERKSGRVVIHDLEAKSKAAQFDDHTHAVRSLSFTQTGSELCSLSQDGVLKIYDAGAMREVLALKNGLDARPVEFSPDGRRIAVGLQNGNVSLWNLEKQEIERRLEGTDDLFGLAFSSDGSLLFAADGNNFVQFWTVADGKGSLAKTVQSRIPAVAEKSTEESQSQESP